MAQGSGHILACPAPQPAEWAKFARALAPLIAALTPALGDAPPRWLSRYVAADELPLRRAVKAVVQQRAELALSLDRLGRRLAPYDRRKLLLVTDYGDRHRAPPRPPAIDSAADRP
jgi:hypothetical protein